MPRPLRHLLPAAILLAAPHALAAQAAAADAAHADTAYARFRGQIRAALGDAGVADPHGLLLVEGLRGSGELQIRLLEGDLPDAALMRVYERLHARPGLWPTDTLRALVRVDEDAFLDLAEIRPEDAPAAQNLDDVLHSVRRFGETHPTLGRGGDAFTARVETVVSRGGTVVFAMVRESSGLPEVDDFAAQTAMALRFRPAHVGNTPVDMWMSLPVTVRVPPRTTAAPATPAEPAPAPVPPRPEQS